MGWILILIAENQDLVLVLAMQQAGDYNAIIWDFNLVVDPILDCDNTTSVCIRRLSPWVS